MEQWEDHGIVLAARPHGEGGAVVSLLTRDHGRHAGYVHAARSSKMRGVLEPGSSVQAHWQARVADNLGTLKLEQTKSVAAALMDDALKLGALQAACSICDAALPEREGHPGLFDGMLVLLDTLDSEVWGPAYVMWEIALLKELGFGLDLTRCAGGGDVRSLAYVSPKTGCAVSEEAGEPYKERLLPLPDFLKPGGGTGEPEEVLKGLQMTGHFLEHWVFVHHTKGVPEARLAFQVRLGKACQKEEA